MFKSRAERIWFQLSILRNQCNVFSVFEVPIFENVGTFHLT